MRLKLKFFGTPVAMPDLVPGDLAFADKHDWMILFLVVGTAARKEYIVLRRWPERADVRVPHPIAGEAFNGCAFRRIDDELLLKRPGFDDADIGQLCAQFPMHADNGNIVVYGETRFALHVTTQRNAVFWDMQSGADIAIATGEIAHVITHWQLVCVDGDDQMVLCEFNVPIA